MSVAALLWAPACTRSGFSPSPSSVCDGVDCSGHGSCIAIDGHPRCACDPGFHNSGALECTAYALPSDAAAADRGAADAWGDSGVFDLGGADLAPVDSGSVDGGASDGPASDLAAADAITADATLPDLGAGDRPTVDAASADAGGGIPCTASNLCASGNCVDSFCCNSACTGTCMACSLAKTGVTNGICAPVTAATDPDLDCFAGAQCDGSGLCKLVLGQYCTAGSECLSSNCVDNYCCNTACAGPCDACSVTGSEGTCTVVVDGAAGSPSCAPYLCNGASATCPSSCSGDADCVSGYACSGVLCVANSLPIGSICSSDQECADGNCVDGFCCDGLCDQLCEGCASSLTGAGDGACSWISHGLDPHDECAGTLVCDGNGACGLKPIGIPCGAGSECISGFCVEGVCCDVVCSGTCMSCLAMYNAGDDGTCDFVIAGADPYNDCPGPRNCLGDGTCE